MMRKMGHLALGLSLPVLAIALTASQGVDISGEWQFTFQSQRGSMTIDVRFVQEGTKLTVTMTGPRGGESSGEGTIHGETVQWSVQRSTGGGERTIAYSGTVKGTTMSGTADLGDLGTVSWTAVKK